jgi:hypothetical protein
MPTGAQLQARIKAVLLKLKATPRTVQFRSIERTGGNDLLGLHGTTTETLTAVTAVAAELVVADQVNSSGGLLQPGDWRFIFAGDTAEADLRTKQILFGDEVLNIVQIYPYAFDEVMAGWEVIARTVKPRTT